MINENDESYAFLEEYEDEKIEDDPEQWISKCRDILSKEGYSVEENKILSEKVKWRPRLFATKVEERIAIDVRVINELDDVYLEGLKTAVELIQQMDVFLAFPGLILVLVFVGVFGRRIEYIMLIYGFLGIPGYARLIRGNVLQAKELPYVQAAKVAGAGKMRIMFRHILPNVIQPVIIAVTFAVGGFILGLAGLAFLGFSDPTFIEWGADISRARPELYSAPWAALFPGLMIVITVLGFMLLGDGLRDALDPRLKNL